METVTPQMLKIAEGLRIAGMPVEQRVIELARSLKREGLAAASARPQAYPLLPVEQSATKLIVEHKMKREEGAFVVCSVQHPNTAVVVTVKKLGTISENRLDGDAVANHLLDDESTEDPRPLPAPIVYRTGDVLYAEFTAASGLDTPAFVAVRGFLVDAITAEVLRRDGELAVLTIVRTYAAAAVMESAKESKVVRPMEVDHLLAKETLTGDAARNSFKLVVKKMELFPNKLVIPPASTRKPGSLLNVALNKDDAITPDLRYTSAGGAGTAAVSLTFIGRRPYGC